MIFQCLSLISNQVRVTKQRARQTSRHTLTGRREARPGRSSHKAMVLLTTLLQKMQHSAYPGTHEKAPSYKFMRLL